MIFDQLLHAGLYQPLHARLARGFDFLLSQPLAELPSGKLTVDGDHVFALVNDYSTRPCEQIPYEAHRRYTDIQYMVRGVEQIGVAPIESLTVAEAYDPSRDIAFFSGQGDSITLRAGTFAVFFPHDAHQPGIAVEAPQMVRKIVMKVALDL